MNVPLHQRLSDEFRHRIAVGVWPEGSPVPSEAELCKEFRTSRGPVRQALAALRSERLIVGGRGRPPMVRPSVLSQSVETFLSFTQWAESLGKIPGQRTYEIARRPAGTEIARHLDIHPDDAVVSLLRLRLLDREPIMVERSHFILEVGKLLFDFDTDSGSIFRFLLESGIDLRSARHTIDAMAADSTDVDMLGIDPGAPLLRERRVTFSSSGQPLEYADDRYRPELANFMIENSLNHRSAMARIHQSPATEESTDD